VQKSGTVDFKTWYRESHGDNTPWGDEESPAVVAEAETALERELSRVLLAGDTKLPRRKLGEGEQVAEMGPGTMLGEGASLEGGVRTAKLRALTSCRVVVIPSELVGDRELAVLATDRRRED
jgi:Cyclic nucleotide-binding domain